MPPVIDADIRRFRYARAETPSLEQVQLRIEPGDFIVLAGRHGSGKTTLSQCPAGVIPQFIQGEFDGTVVVAGQRLDRLPLPRVAGVVGYVQQAAANQLFSLSVQEDVAFGPENLGLEPAEIRARVQRSLDAVGIADLATRLPHELSGGQQQRAVLAAVLALEPACWIFDQPVAELDPVGRDDVYRAIQALNAAGQTVVVVEDRLSDVAELATRIVLLDHGRVLADRSPAEFFSQPQHVHPDAGLRVPLAVQMFHLLRQQGVELGSIPIGVAALVDQVQPRLRRRIAPPAPVPPCPSAAVAGAAATAGPESSSGPVVCALRALGYRYPSGHWALHAGECVAIIGANGAGKSTLAKHVIGLLQPTHGEVQVLGRATHGQTPAELSRHVGFLFQDPDYQTFSLSVLDEVTFGLRARKVPAAEARQRAHRQLEPWRGHGPHPGTVLPAQHPALGRGRAGHGASRLWLRADAHVLATGALSAR